MNRRQANQNPWIHSKTTRPIEPYLHPGLEYSLENLMPQIPLLTYCIALCLLAKMHGQQVAFRPILAAKKDK